VKYSEIAGDALALYFAHGWHTRNRKAPEFEERRMTTSQSTSFFPGSDVQLGNLQLKFQQIRVDLAEQSRLPSTLYADGFASIVMSWRRRNRERN
jgi:hypothetical protein